jgi:hypothetical protein
MLRHVAVAIGDQLDDCQTTAADAATKLASESAPIPGSRVRCPEEPGRSGNVETSRRAEKGFECWGVELLSLRKK